MSAFSRVLLVSSMVLSVAATAANTVMDVHLQADNLLRCWEPVDSSIPATGHTLSEPIYRLCSYMLGENSFDEFFVNGVEEDSDDYTDLLRLFKTHHEQYAVLNVCLQEAFQLHLPSAPSQTSIRCVCKRDGCNLPKNFKSFLDFNKNVIPH